eukprot:TRINITY_DN322_c0_g1_i1.p3 TRINITY_DN322_c0_g1~~TRINITY_DN322_c0_g1_i1.p3  ORF type:complete len:64 (+),score=4.73 TRINITY_DN322_c0_g1_i1:588-779(+)
MKYGQGSKSKCLECGGRYHTKRGDCYMPDNRRKVRCRKLSASFCKNVNCKIRGNKCKGKPTWK